MNTNRVQFSKPAQEAPIFQTHEIRKILPQPTLEEQTFFYDQRLAEYVDSVEWFKKISDIFFSFVA